MDAERENRDAVEGDSMAGFRGGNEVEFGESGEKPVCVLAQFQFGVLVDLNRGEVPHAGEQSGDVRARGGFLPGLRRRKEQCAALRVDENERGQNDFDGVALPAFFGDRAGETELAGFAEFGDGTEETLRRARRAEGGAEFHQRLVPVSGAA